MTTHSILYVGRNTSTLRLDKLKDPETGEYYSDAIVVVDAITLQSGGSVSGVSLPIAMAYVPASDGRYEASISGEQFTAGRTYLFTFHADAGGKQFESQEVVIARQRRA
jgi:hypothetical protein